MAKNEKANVRKQSKGEGSKAPEKEPTSAKGEKVEAQPAKVEADHGSHGAHAAAHAHHKPNRKEYFVIFGVLFVLTILEVAVAQIPGLGKLTLGTALVGLALAKASCVGLYYMHLKHETRVLQLTVAIPLATPMIYALVLIVEAAWRLTR